MRLVLEHNIPSQVDLDMSIQVRNVRSKKASDIRRPPLGAATLLIRPHNLIYTPKFY